MTRTSWLVIPARGGSVSVPRKNLRRLAGRPLITHSIRQALAVPGDTRVVVVTDDDEIAHVAGVAGAEVVLETERTPSGETLDTKIVRNLARLKEMGAHGEDLVATLQPTSPLLKPSTIARTLSVLRAQRGGSALTVAEDRHLRWTVAEDGSPQPMFEARVNRQELPMVYRETGGVIAARLQDIESAGTRVIAPVQLVPLDEAEAVDIDSFADFYAAQHATTRLRVAIRADAGPSLGMGHVYRALAVALELARHDVRIYLSEEHSLGHEFFRSRPFDVEIVRDDAHFTARLASFIPDLVFLDVLDTAADSLNALREAAPGAKIVTFEDAGSGAAHADLLVAEFVPGGDVDPKRVLSGIENSLISPSFETMDELGPFRDRVEEVLVLFGGTDPSGLAARALAALDRADFSGRVTVVRGLGAPDLHFQSRTFDLTVLRDVRHMPDAIRRADFAFTSAGRTIIELATLGVPSICMAQNAKELTHTHAVEAHGVRMLGLGREVTDQDLDAEVARMLGAWTHRAGLRAAAISALSGRSNERTMARILERVGLNSFPNL